MNYNEALEFLFSKLPMYQRVGAPALKYDLNNTVQLLDSFDNPHLKTKCIHIAGTNGKGTSAHALASILTASGYKTGLFTSPHLKSFTERIKINGQMINEAYVADFVSDVESKVKELKPSFFELTFCMAMCYFEAQQIDIAIIETGLGGRLDSTNVIDPEVALITTIGLDHTELLGDTLEKIAWEKAGIIKKGRPVVIGADQPELIHVFREKAEEQHSNFHRCTDISIHPNQENESLFTILSDKNIINEIKLDIEADYFKANLPGIIRVIEILNGQGWQVSNEAIREGLSQVKSLSGLKGRYQILDKSPLTIADISHNMQGIDALFAQINKLPFDKLYVIYGAVKDKSVTEILTFMRQFEATWFFAEAKVPRALPANDLQQIALNLGIEGKVINDVNQAIQKVKALAKAKDLILVCGSTFLIAEIAEL